MVLYYNQMRLNNPKVDARTVSSTVRYITVARSKKWKALHQVSYITVLSHILQSRPLQLFTRWPTAYRQLFRILKKSWLYTLYYTENLQLNHCNRMTMANQDDTILTSQYFCNRLFFASMASIIGWRLAW